MLYSDRVEIGVTANPIKNSLYYITNEEAGIIPPPGSEFIISETGDFIVSESGERLIME